MGRRLGGGDDLAVDVLRLADCAVIAALEQRDRGIRDGGGEAVALHPRPGDGGGAAHHVKAPGLQTRKNTRPGQVLEANAEAQHLAHHREKLAVHAHLAATLSEVEGGKVELSGDQQLASAPRLVEVISARAGQRRKHGGHGKASSTAGEKGLCHRALLMSILIMSIWRLTCQDMCIGWIV